MAKALVARGHAVRVVTVADDETFEVRDGVEVKTLRSLNIYSNYWVDRPAWLKLIWHALENFNPRALFRMRREIAEFQPDVVVTISAENINVATWIAAWMMGCPSVHTIHSYFLMCWRGTMFANGKTCERRCGQCRVASIGKKLCSQVVDGVMAEAFHSLALHREHGYFRKAMTKVIPGAVQSPEPLPPYRAPESSPIRVGFIGMVAPSKGINTLGEAAALLGDTAPIEYVIAGDGEQAYVQDVLEKFPASQTTYLGWSNPKDFYPLIDVLVVPSIWAEPFGNVCVEALSYGIPVIVSRSGALPELIEPEESGLIFNAGDREALADCLLKIVSDRALLSRMHDGALARAKRFSTEAMAGSLDHFLTQVHARREGKRRSIPAQPEARVPSNR